MSRRLQLSVIGAGECDAALARVAFETGREIAARGAVLVCGGCGGVMAAACAGARAGGGLTVGVLPGADPRESPPNADVEVALYSGLGQARNLLVVLSGAAVLALGGGWGTLSEIALALKHRRPVVRLGSWRLERPDGAQEPLLHEAATPAAAVALAFRLAGAEAR